MDVRVVLAFFALVFLLSLVFSAPVDQKKPKHDPETPEEVENKLENEIDDLGLEYGRYLQQVVEALEQDKEFSKKLENVSQEDIKSGKIAQELNFVNHQVRNKLDELKRIELDRLRKLARKEHDLEENGPESEDGRRWRTLGGDSQDTNNLDTVGHLDHQNPHSFEAEDLQKLILAATKDLDELDRKRREDFKNYEMEKELQYRESLQNMTDDQKKDAVKKHDEVVESHKKHAPVHHPGSKQQFQQVWQEQDHMPVNEFNPKTFFAMHDINGDGFLDQQEVEALLTIEIRKIYDPKNPQNDPNEVSEEYHRMREHIYKEADTNRDGLISKKEFLDYTARIDFEKDEVQGWQSIDESQVYSEQDLKNYEAQRQRHYQQMQQYGAYQLPEGYPQQYYGYQAVHPNEYHPQVHGQLHPAQQQAMLQQQAHMQQQAMLQQQAMQQQQHQQYQQVPQQQYQQIPQQQFQQVPPQQYQQIPQQGVQQHPSVQAPPQQYNSGPQIAGNQYQGQPHPQIQQPPPQHHQAPQQHQQQPPLQHQQQPNPPQHQQQHGSHPK